MKLTSTWWTSSSTPHLVDRLFLFLPSVEQGLKRTFFFGLFKRSSSSGSRYPCHFRCSRDWAWCSNISRSAFRRTCLRTTPSNRSSAISGTYPFERITLWCRLERLILPAERRAGSGWGVGARKVVRESSASRDGVTDCSACEAERLNESSC